MRYACSACLFPADDRDCWISDHLFVEGWGFYHIDVYFEMELFGHKTPQRPPVAVFHPTIRTDETQTSTRREQKE